MVEKVGLDNFSTIFMIPRTSSEFFGKSGKSCHNQLFPQFGPPKRLESWKKLVLTTFFHHFHDSKDFLINSWKKWKKLAWPTFSTTQAVLEARIVENVGQSNFSTMSMIPKTSSEIAGKLAGSRFSRVIHGNDFVLRNRGALLFIIE